MHETIADAMMDRLIHTAHKLELKSGSMREYLGLFKNLCQTGKINNTKGHTDEYRDRC